MNNSPDKGLQRKELLISVDRYSKGSSGYPLLNIISAELQAPIAMIRTNIQLLRNFCNHLDISLLTEIFVMCEDSIESIHGFIEKIDLICISDKSLLKLKPEWFSISLATNQVFAELGQLNHDISRIKFINSSINYNLCQDKYLFRRILVNLLSNALKFSTGEVELEISSTKNELSIIVSDSGIGIPENQFEEIFNPFVRAINARKIKGSGLGLSIVANVVKCLNGDITLRSEVGKGTEFRIAFPVFKSESDFIQKSRENKSPTPFKISDSGYSLIIGTISHELRTPVAILKSNIQLLKELTLSIDDSVMNKSICNCEASLNHMIDFFDRLPRLNIDKITVFNVNPPNSGLNNLHVN